MKYKYKGRTKKGSSVSGTIEAPSIQNAKDLLKKMEIRPLQLQLEKWNLQANLNIQIGSVIDLKGLIVFTRQLSSLINSGVTVVMALQILSEQERRPRFRAILMEVKNHIESGGGFAEGLQKHSKVFSDFFIRVIEAGEMSGSLDKSLIRIGQQLEKLNNIRRKVIGAMIYPVLTLVVAVGVVAFLLIRVVPEIVKMYQGSELPSITVFVISLSKMVQDHFFGVFGFLILSVVGLRASYKVPKIRAAVDPLLLKIPILGLLFLRSGVAIFARTLSTLIGSGVQLLAAFEICERVSSNFEIKNCIRDAASSVTEGRTISEGLSKRKVIPPMVIHMINIGEMTGKLDDLLLKIADIYDEEVDDAVGMMTTLLQPMLMLFVGGIIMVIILAIYMPIFSMADKMGG